MQNAKCVLKASTTEITDTKGALAILRRRQGGREYSDRTLQYHAQHGNLPVYVFDDGDLVQWVPGGKRLGASYIFLRHDVESFPLRNRAGRKPKAVLDGPEAQNKPFEPSVGKSYAQPQQSRQIANVARNKATLSGDDSAP